MKHTGLLVGLLAIVGCGGDPSPAPAPGSRSPAPSSTANSAPRPRHRAPVALGGAASAAGKPSTTGPVGLEGVLAGMKPLQVLLGKWRAISRKEQEIVELEWVWDFKTDPDQPTLTLECPDNPYFSSGRLTWLAADRRFRLTATDRDGSRRVYQGGFTVEPRFVPGDDDDKLQTTFKIELTERDSEDRREAWRVTINQQANNRFLMELARRRGRGTFHPQYTLGSQRRGTSFAASDSDYGERTCVISQGLGTIQVSYQGMTYWVCCTGCQAAFEEEPEKWIARFKALKKKQ